MTRNGLIKITLNEMDKPSKNIERINTCKAFIVKATPNFYIVVSYHTPVAVYVKSTGTMYVFNFYSATTQLHIRKAAVKLDAMRFTYLYQRTDKYVEIGIKKSVNSFRPSKREWQYIFGSDYSPEIDETSILRALNY